MGILWALALPDAVRRVEPVYLGRYPYAFSTFGRDPEGEIYAADPGPGGVYRLVAR